MIDLLNQRLSAGTRLRQREVLHIFSDVAKAVARLHHRTKPTIHRDLKVSTVESLITYTLGEQYFDCTQTVHL